MVLKQNQSYSITWNDTYNHIGWHDLEDVKKKTLSYALQETVGFFVKEDKYWYIFAQHKNPHEGFMPWGTLCWIPKGCVQKIKKV